ncbi:hypothetical protein PM082_012566 [Marasmius tenuissimus]|nr:hypothetical protein PM082_012566 [Marasmius tenuissimus]
MPFGPRREALSPTQSYSSSSISLLGNIIPRDFDAQTAVPTTYTSTISSPIIAGIVAGVTVITAAFIATVLIIFCRRRKRWKLRECESQRSFSLSKSNSTASMITGSTTVTPYDLERKTSTASEALKDELRHRIHLENIEIDSELEASFDDDVLGKRQPQPEPEYLRPRSEREASPTNTRADSRPHSNPDPSRSDACTCAGIDELQQSGGLDRVVLQLQLLTQRVVRLESEQLPPDYVSLRLS